MTAGRWTFTCPTDPQASGGGEHAVAGCGHHEHHHAPKAADLMAREHQADHARINGAPHRDVPKMTDDEAWGPFVQQWRVPVVSMDAGRRQVGCKDCDELHGPPPAPMPPSKPVPKAGPDFY